MAPARYRKKFIGTLAILLPGLLWIALSAILIATRLENQNAYTGSWPVHNLQLIEGAKDQWALENKKDVGAVPTPSDLAPYFKNGVMPGWGDGNTYRINPIGTPATTKLARDVGRYRAGTVLTNR